MDDQQLEMLRTQDWEEIPAKVMSAAAVFARRYGWGHDSALPGGKSLEDVVVEAICDIWEKPERLNPSCGLTAQIKGIVKSKLWNLSQRADGRVKRSELEEIVGTLNEGTAKVEDRDEFDRAMELLGAHPKVKSKPDLELVVVAISCGAMDVDAVVKETCLPRDRIYQLMRELRALYPPIARQLRDGGRAS